MSEKYWLAVVSLTAIAVLMVLLVVRRTDPSLFNKRAWAVVRSSAIFWAVFSMAMLWGNWDLYYSHFYPGWVRWAAPFSAVVYGALGYALYWLAGRLPGNAIVNFCLMGGLATIPEHLWAVHGLGILEKVPYLKGVGTVSVIAFAVPEYVVYWSIVLYFSALQRRGGRFAG